MITRVAHPPTDALTDSFIYFPRQYYKSVRPSETKAGTYQSYNFSLNLFKL